MQKYIGIPGKMPHWVVTRQERKKQWVQERHERRLLWSSVLAAIVLIWALEIIAGYLCWNGRLSGPEARQLQADLLRTASETKKEHDRYRHYPEPSQNQDRVVHRD